MPAPIGGVTSAPPPQSSANDALTGLDGHAFLKLLVAQLRYQNPMAPSDPAAMLQQTSALRQVETLQQLSTTNEHMVRMQHATMAAGLIGKHVEGVTEQGDPITGIVDSVRFTEGGPVLLVGGTEMPFDYTLGISAPPSSNPTPAP